MSDARQPLLDGDHGTRPSSGIERSNELTSATAPSGDAQDDSQSGFGKPLIVMLKLVASV